MRKITPVFLIFLLTLSLSSSLLAQYGEPPVRSIDQPRNLYDEGYKFGLGFSFELSDFGFGVGVQLRKGLSPYTEGLFNIGIKGLRDPSEQTYIDYYIGNRTIPGKYQRVTTFPLSIGLKRRVFARQITDNFRVHTAMSFGPTFAMTTPYFNDINDNGFRESNPAEFSIYEPVLDIFQGLKDADWKFGWNGDLILGIDFSENFARLQTFQFGYSFYYFKDGLQIMEPFEPIRDRYGNILDDEPDGIADGFQRANSPTDYFGSAKVTFVFGWMW